ncbi:MAG: diaminopimelate epimerase [Bacteroidota bacterium]
MTIQFTKMTGAGNDFVVIDNRSGRITKGSILARKLCDRRWGIGADGLLLLEKSTRGAYRMMYYNADGSYGGMCGNGGRCIALYAVKKRIAPKNHSFEALNHIYQVSVASPERVSLRMKDPFDLRLNFMLPFQGKRVKASYVNTGSPHVVIPVRALGIRGLKIESVDVTGLGREIRYHKAFQPSGTNVNFIELVSSKRLKIRTYERGVESETLACGTGSVASAIIASRLFHKMKPPITILPKSRSPLIVDFDLKGDLPENVTLQGPAKIVFEGKAVL